MAKGSRRRFYRVRREGATKVLAVGLFLPPKWTIVEIKKVSEDKGKSVTLQIDKIA